MLCVLVLGSDVIYSEWAVTNLLATLRQLSGNHTTTFLAGELRNGELWQLKTIRIFLFYFLDKDLSTHFCGRCRAWVLLGGSNGWVCNRAYRSGTMASWILQSSDSNVHFSEETAENRLTGIIMEVGFWEGSLLLIFNHKGGMLFEL